MLPQMHNYPTLKPGNVRSVAKRSEGGLERELVVIQTPYGYRRAAELFRPQSGESLAGIVYAHWYEPEAHDSNRRQFADEAKEMAQRGAACLLVETMWSDLDFFIKRTQADDEQNSNEEVINLRRAIDFLLTQPGVDKSRFAFVGHDFGGMYGVLAGSIDKRPTHYVIMAATPRFPDWYLYYPRLEGEEREAFIDEMKAIDPIEHVARLAPSPVFFQFATDDPHVPKERAEAFFEAAEGSKEMRWYESGHGLNERAEEERKAWLVEQLTLKDE